jgi:hypothetical protein
MFDQIRILFVGVNPDDTALLDLVQEAETIQARLHTAMFRERLEFVQRWKTEARFLPGLLMQYRPRILHFSGHGTPDGRLYFRGTDGVAVPADEETIAGLFRLVGGVRCVVLNACHSTEQARLIARHVDVVIGMSAAVRDEDAIAFAAGFYEGLGFGKDVRTAFELGRLQVGLTSDSGEDVCMLHVREGVDASKLLPLRGLPSEPSVSAERELAREPLSEQGAHARGGLFFLEIVSGPEEGRRMLLEKDRIVVGRREWNDLCLRGSSLSSSHFQLVRMTDGYAIEDLNTKNGTYVNGYPVPPGRLVLQDGDRIHAGSFILLYRRE